ncbi:hypothetical protein AN958_02547 [Leucoagaricus sp. SymC.cos]|nr:hypothetical protein AN958_02547 [Leucoagaricus sp. SymC.cos]
MVSSNVLALHGGYGCSDPYLFMLDLVTRTWLRITITSGRNPGGCYGHSMTVVGTTLFMFGGIQQTESKGGWETLDELWVFDLNSMRTQPKWELVKPSLGALPSSRKCHNRDAGTDMVMFFRFGADYNALATFLRPEKLQQLLYLMMLCTKIFIFGGRAFRTGDTITVLDTKHVNNSDIHTPERLIDLDIDPHAKDILEVKKKLAEVEKDKEELMRENSKLEKRLTELEKDNKESKRRELITAILESLSEGNALASLQYMDAQMMVDFLTEALESQNLLQLHAERRHILYLLLKKICDLGNPINNYKSGYGSIYKGVCEGQVVCVKAVCINESGPNADKVMRAQIGELALLSAYSSHVNVIPLYGAYLSAEHNPRICIVSPWMENGDLTDYLMKFPDAARIPLMADVAAGLRFLHDAGIVHADLKARNVLISQSQRALLADFGVLSILNTNMGTSSAGNFLGTACWMAPELLIAEEQPVAPTQESDMWGFGCICFEAFTGETPFIKHYKYPIQLVVAFTSGQVTPLRPKRNCSPIIIHDGPLVMLAEKCWNYKPSERPTAAEVLQSLTELNVQDNRPSMDEELATFEAVKSKRGDVKIDYRYLHSVVRKNHVDKHNGDESANHESRMAGNVLLVRQPGMEA